jgi:hypothetical protein
LSPDERRTAIARILAGGVLRLWNRAALLPDDGDRKNPSNPGENRLEAVSENPLTVHVG